MVTLKLPYTIQNYLADQDSGSKRSVLSLMRLRRLLMAEIDRLMGIHGKRSVDSIHKELGHIMWECRYGSNKEGLRKV